MQRKMISSSNARVPIYYTVAMYIFTVLLVSSYIGGTASSIGVPQTATSTAVISENNNKIIITENNNNENDNKIITLPLVPHHVQKARRRRQLQEKQEQQQRSNTYQRAAAEEEIISAKHVGSLYQGYGTHYVDVWCGSPPQRQTVIVDTGSSVTAFPCSGCHDCGEVKYHTDDLFRQEHSTSYETIKCGQCARGHCKGQNCEFGVSYQEGSSWNALESKDFCYITGPHGEPLPVDTVGEINIEDDNTADINPTFAASLRFKLLFGCQLKLTGLFKTQLADGIMGMDVDNFSYWKQLHASGKITKQLFSLCFVRAPHVDREGSEAGAIVLGGVDTRIHSSPIVYATYSRSGGFFAVKPRKMYLRNGGGGNSALSTNPNSHVKQIDIPASSFGRTIVDSGTTDTYMTRRLAASFKVVWKEIFGQAYSQSPISLLGDQLDGYPTILIQLEGNTELNSRITDDPDSTVGLAGSLDPDHPYDVIVAVPPRNYMELDSDTGKYVNRIYLDEPSGIVLGANVMMGHDVIFDMDSSNVGWAESDCNYMNLVEQYGLGGGGGAAAAADTESSSAADTTDSTIVQTAQPTSVPTAVPTATPTIAATAEPTASPTAKPTLLPTAAPTVPATTAATAEPTAQPTTIPTLEPTATAATPLPTVGVTEGLTTANTPGSTPVETTTSSNNEGDNNNGAGTDTETQSGVSSSSNMMIAGQEISKNEIVLGVLVAVAVILAALTGYFVGLYRKASDEIAFQKVSVEELELTMNHTNTSVI